MKTQQFHLGSGGVLQAQLALGNPVPSAQPWTATIDHGVLGLVSYEREPSPDCSVPSDNQLWDQLLL